MCCSVTRFICIHNVAEFKLQNVHLRYTMFRNQIQVTLPCNYIWQAFLFMFQFLLMVQGCCAQTSPSGETSNCNSIYKNLQHCVLPIVRKILVRSVWRLHSYMWDSSANNALERRWTKAFIFFKAMSCLSSASLCSCVSMLVCEHGQSSLYTFFCMSDICDWLP